jgi:transposase
MMNEDQLKLEARLIAIEYMLANVYALLHRLFGTPPEAILKNHEKAREMLRVETIPGLDPVMADMMMAEVQAAVEDMLSSIEEMTGVRKKPSR